MNTTPKTKQASKMFPPFVKERPRKRGAPGSRARSRSARQIVLAQWRGADFTDLEKAQAPSTRPINGVMPNVLSELGLDRRRIESEILKVWKHLIDPNVAAHAFPTGLRNGTLFVTVDHSVWLSEIVRYRRKEILQRLQHSFGIDLIARISYRVG